MRTNTVFPDSPAEMAGLQPETDFILGGENAFFRNLMDLMALVKENLNKQLLDFVNILWMFVTLDDC